MWANVSIASALETRDLETRKDGAGWSRRGRCCRVILAWGVKCLFPPTRWAGCHAVIAPALEVGGAWVKDNFEFPG